MALVVSRFRTVNLPHMTWSCSGFPFALVPNMTSLVWSLTVGSPSNTMSVVMRLVSPRELVFCGWLRASLWTPLCYFVVSLLTSLFLCISVPNLSIVLLCVELLSHSSSRVPNAFGGKDFPWPRFLVVKSSPSRCLTMKVIHGLLEFESLFVQWDVRCLYRSSTFLGSSSGPSIRDRGVDL